MPKKKKKSPLEKLTQAWTKASSDERQQFLDFLSGQDNGNGLVGSNPKTAAPIATGRYLTRETIAETEYLMRERNLDIATLSAECGLDENDHALHRALKHGYPLRLVVVKTLQLWLTKNTRSRPPFP